MSAATHVHDVAVLGGGVLGNFIAFDLAREGLDTVLLERGYTASGTSGATHAWIYVSTKTPGFYGRFSYASSLRYEALAREHGVDFQYERSGGLSILWTDAQLEEARRTVRDQNEAGIECHLLTPEEVAAKEPIVSPEHIKGAIYGPLDGCVNPFSVMYAMNRLAREAGAEFRPYTEVTAVARDGDAFRITTSSRRRARPQGRAGGRRLEHRARAHDRLRAAGQALARSGDGLRADAADGPPHPRERERAPADRARHHPDGAGHGDRPDREREHVRGAAEGAQGRPGARALARRRARHPLVRRHPPQALRRPPGPRRGAGARRACTPR